MDNDAGNRDPAGGRPVPDVDGRGQRVLTDPGMIRALTHPARLEIVEHLGATGAAATATELAGIVGLSPSATSYHLRAMARWGLVEEAEGTGDGRERRWRVVKRGLHWEPSGGSAPDPDQFSAGRALVELILARADERVRQWFARATDEPDRWDEEVAITHAQLMVTDAEMARINAALEDLLRPYARRNRPDPPAGARAFWVAYRAVPTD
jgi:DNA-binding transcriptional ArsR family regulator